MKILMICLGNICRSPLAEGILKRKITKMGLSWEVDSAGTSAWHVGERPDPRSIQIASDNGIDISNQRARQLTKEDYNDYDILLAMDVSNYNNTSKITGQKVPSDKIKMILNYSYPNQNRNVPDPYYNDGFDSVFNMLEVAIDRLVEENH